MTVEEYIKNKNNPIGIATNLSINFSVELFRHYKGTRKELSEKTGINITTIREIYDGKPNITLLQMAKIAVAIGFDLSGPHLLENKKSAAGNGAQ